MSRRAGIRCAGSLSAVVVAAGLVVVAPTLTASSPASASTPGTALTMNEFVNDGLWGRTWNDYNLTADSQGPSIAGRVSPITYGTTVHFYGRTAGGDLIEFANDGLWGRIWNAYDLTVDANGPTLAGDPGALHATGNIVHVYVESSTGDLVEYINDGVGGRLWNAYDLTQLSGGPTLGGDPVPILANGVVEVFARADNGDLVEYAANDAGGHLWNAYDLTQLSGGPMVAGDPSPVVQGTTTAVFAQASGGDLIEMSSSDGHSWTSTDITQQANGPGITGRPSAIASGTSLGVFARTTSGQLVEYTNASGSWSALDVTQAGGGPAMAGDPSAINFSGTTDVFVQAASNDLLEYSGALGSSAWRLTDVTSSSGGPGIGVDPVPIVYGVTVHIYAGGPPPASPPSGVGVYGLDPGPSVTAQAIEAGWPIIGDTGALGTESPPYTGLTVGADLATGEGIAASGRRVTWLSFWTVSGPVASGPNGQPCWTSACYYADGYGAGQWVAQTVDVDASSVGRAPDWVILDPEGFPDEHSGLDPGGPGSTAANWLSFITGWAQGIESVNPYLRPAFYADQFEYNTFDLAAIQLPAFVAVAFPNPTDILTSDGNVAGFIAFGATCPAQSEEATLMGPPWNGTFNTLQFDAGTFCTP